MQRLVGRPVGQQHRVEARGVAAVALHALALDHALAEQAHRVVQFAHHLVEPQQHLHATHRPADGVLDRHVVRLAHHAVALGVGRHGLPRHLRAHARRQQRERRAREHEHRVRNAEHERGERSQTFNPVRLTLGLLNPHIRFGRARPLRRQSPPKQRLRLHAPHAPTHCTSCVLNVRCACASLTPPAPGACTRRSPCTKTR